MRSADSCFTPALCKLLSHLLTYKQDPCTVVTLDLVGAVVELQAVEISAAVEEEKKENEEEEE